METVRCLFIFFTGLVVVEGFCVFVTGCWAAANPKSEVFDVVDADSSKIKNCGIFVLMIGLMTMLIGAIGIFGAIKENSTFLTAFAIIHIPIVILSLACIIVVALSPEPFKKFFMEELEDQKTNWTEEKSVWSTVYKFQTDNACCFFDSDDGRCSNVSKEAAAEADAEDDSAAEKVIKDVINAGKLVADLVKAKKDQEAKAEAAAAAADVAAAAAENETEVGDCVLIVKEKLDKWVHRGFVALMVLNVLHFLLSIGGLGAACYMARKSRK